jgi:hypothetical protein
MVSGAPAVVVAVGVQAGRRDDVTAAAANVQPRAESPGRVGDAPGAGVEVQVRAAAAGRGQRGRQRLMGLLERGERRAPVRAVEIDDHQPAGGHADVGVSPGRLPRADLPGVGAGVAQAVAAARVLAWRGAVGAPAAAATVVVGGVQRQHRSPERGVAQGRRVGVGVAGGHGRVRAGDREVRR